PITSRAPIASSRRSRSPTRSGAAPSSSMCRATCPRLPPPTSRPRSDRSPMPRSTSPRWRPRSRGRRSAPTPTWGNSSAPRSKRGGCARFISPAPRRPPARGRSIITSVFTPFAARRSRVSWRCRLRRSSNAKNSSSCARSKRVCASTRPSSTACRSASTPPRSLRGRAQSSGGKNIARRALAEVDRDRRRAYRNGHDGTQEDRVPGRAGSELPPRLARRLSGLRAGAVRDLRRCICRDQQRRGRARHDPDRKLGRRPRRRHSPSLAGLRPAHRRRAFHAGAASALGAEGGNAQGHQDGRERARCRKVSRKLGVKPVVAADTAGSAREVAEIGDKTRAAIASRLAAEIYGLDILAQDIEDEDHNTTRFIVLSRDAKWAKSDAGPIITTFLFRVRNVPAALYKALGGFATNGVNMTKLESYMIEGNFFATQFYADVEGHPEDRSLVFAFEELAFYSKEMKILGVYPAHPFRAT